MFFACSKHSNFESEQSFFFQTFFFPPNVHHSFWKLERILTLMIRKAKVFEVMNLFFVTHLNTFGSQVFLTLKIMDFENVALTKVGSYICDGKVKTHSSRCVWKSYW
jgi:hypothetical protein